jgi:tetratricopeptide (TPR) repeat protein
MRGHRFNVPRPVVDELESSAGADRGSKLASRLAEATHAYDHDRYQDARRVLRTLAAEVPDAPAVRELAGLVLYRMGRWAAAAKELEVYRQLSGSYDQHPVLADCYRALRRFKAADKLWDELRRASPNAEVVAEGRIVAAGCRADQGDLAAAIALLERADRHLRRPEGHHLRQWYVLADLYERAGDLPRARDLFGRIVAADPGAYDSRQRLRALK